MSSHQQYLSCSISLSVHGVRVDASGTHHKVAEKDLKPAKRVIKAKRRNKGRPAAKAQRASQLDIIVDV